MRLHLIIVFVVFVLFRLGFMWFGRETENTLNLATKQEKSSSENSVDQEVVSYSAYTLEEVQEDLEEDSDDDYYYAAEPDTSGYTTSKPSTPTTAESDDNTEQEQFQNLRLVFLGDSLTRYQYLSLAYRLRFGRWFDPKIKVNNLVSAHSFHHPLHPKEDWNEFFLQSNRLLHPMEICDCLRSHDGSVVLERRYFYDEENNNMLVYINMNGKETSPGHGYYGRLKPDSIFGPQFSDIESLPFGMQAEGSYNESNIEWDFPTWADVIRYHIGSLTYDYNSKENDVDADVHLLLNAGLHPHDFRNLSVASDIQKALNKTSLHGVWKTTTYPLQDLIEFQAQLKFSSESPKRPYTRNTDRKMCSMLDSCFNVSWTSLLKPDLYLDDLHFLEPVYRVLNEDYLAQLNLLPRGYKTANRSSILVDDAIRWLT